MDATAIDSRIAALVAGDSLIEQRLTELDAKVAAWLEAMKAGQAALLGGVRAAPPSRRMEEEPPTIPPPPVEAPAAEAAEPAAEPLCDDERLLASLDAETANAIRVKRRLSRDRRPVRELLADIQAARAPEGQSGPTRKRWWRRNDG